MSSGLFEEDSCDIFISSSVLWDGAEPATAEAGAALCAADENCRAVKEPEKHRPAIDNNIIAVLTIFIVLSNTERLHGAIINYMGLLYYLM
jgi:hypothetical protein